MASVSKDARWDRYWYAHYTDPLGRRRKKSTGLTSKNKALEMAHALQRAANEARRGVLTEQRTRDLLSEILQSVNGEGCARSLSGSGLNISRRSKPNRKTNIRQRSTSRSSASFSISSVQKPT